MTSRASGHDVQGFTLVELLVAGAITMVIATMMLTLVNVQMTLARAVPERLDMQQRARVAVDTLSRALRLAGAGIDAGPRTGPLAAFVPAVLPRRVGLTAADAVTTARADAFTVAFIAEGTAQTVARTAFAGPSPAVEVAAYASCPPPANVCGLSSGTTVVAFNDQAVSDWFRVTSVAADVVSMQALQAGGAPHPAGDIVAVAERHTYYLDAATRQLRHYDGAFSDTPVVDDVVDLVVEYFGDPSPPSRPVPAAGQSNCLYDASGAPRGGLAVLTPQGGSLAPLPLSLFVDGPWCGTGANQFDADLLRVRRVRVTVRVQASPSWARGGGAAFRAPGTATSALTETPDLALTFDVSPRNLAIGRRSAA